MRKSCRLIVATLSVALLGACANVDVDRSVASFDEEIYTRDLSECRGGSAVVFVAEAMGHTLLGSAYGLLHGAYYGALTGDSGEGAVVGTIVGGAVGLGVGGHDAVIAQDEDLVSCLRDKGYSTGPL